MNDVRASNKLLKRVAVSTLADKILLLLPVLETRLGMRQTQQLANAFALRKDIPLESNTDLRFSPRRYRRFFTSTTVETGTKPGEQHQTSGSVETTLSRDLMIRIRIDCGVPPETNKDSVRDTTLLPLSLSSTSVGVSSQCETELHS